MSHLVWSRAGRNLPSNLDKLSFYRAFETMQQMPEKGLFLQTQYS
jgi:hypothetical protein